MPKIKVLLQSNLSQVDFMQGNKKEKELRKGIEEQNRELENKKKNKKREKEKKNKEE